MAAASEAEGHAGGLPRKLLLGALLQWFLFTLPETGEPLS